MSRIVIFGAGGRAGRAAVAEACQRGHEVTAVVRDPAKHRGLAAGGVRLVSGDITDGDSVTRVAQGHDAAIHAAADLGAQPESFSPARQAPCSMG